MSKSKYIKTLNELKEILSADREALRALELLKSRVELLKERENLKGPDSEFPLPREISGGGYALFSDGACRGNPGPGAWGMMGQDSSGAVIFTASGVETRTTNNRMELIGAISGMEILLSEDDFDESSTVCLYSDSKYVVDGAKSWVEGWKGRGWKKSDKSVPENIDLWRQLDQLKAKFTDLRFFWVKGHSGHPQNEKCDLLANQALDEAGF